MSKQYFFTELCRFSPNICDQLTHIWKFHHIKLTHFTFWQVGIWNMYIEIFASMNFSTSLFILRKIHFSFHSDALALLLTFSVIMKSFHGVNLFQNESLSMMFMRQCTLLLLWEKENFFFLLDNSSYEVLSEVIYE